VTVRSRCERSRLCLGPPTSVEIAEQRVAQRGLVNSQHGLCLVTSQEGANPRWCSWIRPRARPGIALTFGFRGSTVERIRTTEWSHVGAWPRRKGLDLGITFGGAEMTRMWVTKLITTNRAEHAGRWLWERGSLGPRRTSRGGEDEGKHHWASGANREPTCSVHHFGSERALHRMPRGMALSGAGSVGVMAGSREGAGEVEAMGAH